MPVILGNKGAPGHKFGDVFDVDVVGVYGGCSGIWILAGCGIWVAGVAAFGAGIVGAFRRSSR